MKGVNVWAFDARGGYKPRTRKGKPKEVVTVLPSRRCKGTLTIRPSKGLRADRGAVYVGNTDREEAALWLR